MVKKRTPKRTKPASAPVASGSASAFKRRTYKGGNAFIASITMHGGMVDTPRPSDMPPFDEMPVIKACGNAEGMVVNDPGVRFHAHKAVINGEKTEVFGDDCTVNGDRCIIHGKRAIVNGNHCIVRGDDATIRGHDCIVARESVAKKVFGNRCTIRGIVIELQGSHVKLDGGSIFEVHASGSNSFSFKF